jgi:hypothetical protein
MRYSTHPVTVGLIPAVLLLAAGSGWPDNCGGGALCVEGSSPTFSHCLFLDCEATNGANVYCHGGSSGATLTCCDIYHNGGDDWEGCIAGQSVQLRDAPGVRDPSRCCR